MMHVDRDSHCGKADLKRGDPEKQAICLPESIDSLFREAAGVEARLAALRPRVADSSGREALGCAERLHLILQALRAALEREAALGQKVEALRAQALERMLCGGEG